METGKGRRGGGCTSQDESVACLSVFTRRWMNYVITTHPFR